MRRGLASLAVGFAALAVIPGVLSGCQAPEATDSTRPASGTASGTSPAATANTPGASATSADPSAYTPGGPAGPLEEILGWAAVAVGSAQDVIEQERRVQDAIAACMAEQGFSYIPAVPSPEEITIFEGPARGSPAFVQLYGYGILNGGGEQAGSFMVELTDPNDELLQAMSDAERTAYEVAMYGTVSSAGADGAEYRGGGCQDEGFQVITGLTAPGGDPAAAVIDEATAFLLELHTDAAFDALNAEWATCLGTQGWTYASPFDAEARFGAVLEDQFDGDPLPAEELAALRQEEKAVALADLTCREQVDYLDRYNAIDLQLQANYVETNAADLALLGDAAG